MWQTSEKKVKKSHKLLKKMLQTSKKKSQKVTNQGKKSQTCEKMSQDATNQCKKDTNL